MVSGFGIYGLGALGKVFEISRLCSLRVQLREPFPLLTISQLTSSHLGNSLTPYWGIIGIMEEKMETTMLYSVI